MKRKTSISTKQTSSTNSTPERRHSLPPRATTRTTPSRTVPAPKNANSNNNNNNSSSSRSSTLKKSGTTVVKSSLRKGNSNTLSNIMTTPESGEIFELISTIQLSSNSKSIVKSGNSTVWCGCKDGMIHIIDYESGDVINKLEGPTYKGSQGPQKIDVTTIEIINDYIWTGSTEGNIRMWDINTMEIYRELQGHTACVCCILSEPIRDEDDPNYASYQRLVFSGSQDWTIRVWNAAGTFIRQLLGHSSWARCLIFDPIENRLWSGGDEGSIRIWDQAETGECLRTIDHAHDKGVMSFTNSNGKLWSGGGDGVIKVWNAKGELLQTVQAHKGWINCMLPVADMVWTGSTDKTVRIWSDQGKQLKAIQFDSYIGVIHKWGNRVWISTSNKSVSIYRISNSKLLQRISKYDEAMEREKLEQKMLLEKKLLLEREFEQQQERLRRERELQLLLSTTQSNLLAEERAKKDALFRIKELEQIIASLKKKIAYLEDLLEKEREINAQLRLQLTESQQELQDLLVKIEFYEMMEEDLKSQLLLKEKELEGTAMKDDYELILTNLKRQLQKVTQQNGELKQQYQSMKDSLDEEMRKLKESNEVYQRNEIQQQLLNDQLQFSLQQIAESESTHHDLNKQIYSLQNEVTQLNAKLVDSSDQLHFDLQDKNNMLTKEIEQLKNRLIEQQNQSLLQNEEIKKNFIEQNQTLQNDYSTTQRDLENRLNGTLQRLNELENENKGLSDQLENTNENWSKKYAALNEQFNQSKTANDTLHNDRDLELKSLTDQIKQMNGEWSEKHTDLIDQLNKSKSVIETLQNDQLNQSNESQRNFDELLNENQQLKDSLQKLASVEESHQRLVDQINELQVKGNEDKNELSLTVSKLQKENELLQISTKCLHDEKEKEISEQKVNVEQLQSQLQKAIERAVLAERMHKDALSEFQKLKLELDGSDDVSVSGSSENTIGLRQQLALLQQKNLELLNDDSAVREAKRNFQIEMQKALSETKQLLIDNFNREINEYQAQISKLEKDHQQKMSSMELGYEQQLRSQKLSLDEQYRDILEQSKTNAQSYKTKFDDLNENFQTLTTWIMSGMANNGIAPDSNFNPTVVKVAFMLKKGDRIKNWKRRLFILKNDGEVVYYGTTDSPKPRGTISLRDLTEIRQSPGTAEVPDSLDIITPSRIWYLHFDNPELEKSWIKGIKDFTNKRRSSVRS